ncbi:MAG: hypothetical protein RL557_414 [archaeon]|jgi:large subunit ribosomal protein L30
METKIAPKKEKIAEKKSESGKLLAVVRIHGMVQVKYDVDEALNRLRLRRKYACVFVNSDDKTMMGMLKKVRFFVAYGDVDKDILTQLIKARGKSLEGNAKKVTVKAEEVAEGLMQGKKLTEFGLKPFFRLHPPRKGINSKLQYPKGALGNHKKHINKLLERMM